ncbi:hypothetical protein COCOBI_09-1280 [Coccomyxa sp. Obi]|nr:hypothetical protein COCOBI_09-1280 [Coccomyxa sp. Obi]
MAKRVVFLCTCLLASLVLASTAQQSALDASRKLRQARSLQEQTIKDLFDKFMKQLESMGTPDMAPPSQAPPALLGDATFVSGPAEVQPHAVATRAVPRGYGSYGTAGAYGQYGAR